VIVHSKEENMNEQNQNPVTNPTNPTTPPSVGKSWREQRSEERMARRQARWESRAGRPYGWTGGAFLILLGLIFLLQNMGMLVMANWWALFILIPAFWCFVAAWEIYADTGRLTRRAAGSLITGIALTILALVFLSSLEIGLFWPVLLIVGGFAILASGFLPD
jgi:hypothetical protein